MQVPVDDIIVKKRIRRDMGDIESLAESLKRFGQISPIVISKKNVLIAGGRRLEAAKHLGWRSINAVISENSGELERLELEVEENIQRRDFSMEEVAEATRKIYRLQNPGLLRRIFNAIIRFCKRLLKLEDA
ncbi:MAG: ParB N-terminal domain-containing protein [Treponema sp.]|jgi:ParB family chromosome partitioning protein|nr:ParB N-terminal domain-containing protein [Treponema sp.]